MPAILEVLVDSVSHSTPAVVAALALIRLAVTGWVEETGGRYGLGTAGERS